MKKLALPLTKDQVKDLHAGDSVLLSGVILTARDCAHKRIFEYIKEGKKLPFDLKDAIIYYAGPCPAKPGMASGSCGPTTSARMDSFAPKLRDMGLGGMVGKIAAIFPGNDIRMCFYPDMGKRVGSQGFFQHGPKCDLVRAAQRDAGIAHSLVENQHAGSRCCLPQILRRIGSVVVLA